LGFPVGLISDARLVLTDDLIREALRRAKGKTKAGLGDGAPAPNPGDIPGIDVEDE
jgi:ribosome maturation factor RimP